MVEVAFSVDHHKLVMYSVSRACLVLPGFGISSMRSKYVGGRTKCCGKHCLAVDLSGLTISWSFRQLSI